MGSDQWLTPRFVLDALGEFDLDPCSAPDPAIWPTAKAHITLPRDGLTEPWAGRVWLNPPYGDGIWAWLARLAVHGDGIALVFARTETAGFVRTVWRRADAILFIHRRLTFHRPDGSLPSADQGGGNSGAPSCLVAYGEANHRALARAVRSSTLEGSLVSGWVSTPAEPSLF